jgi:hypothetical protein
MSRVRVGDLEYNKSTRKEVLYGPKHLGGAG